MIRPASVDSLERVVHETVLWDVVEEHLDEAAFCFEQFEQALDHPGLTLSELHRFPEARLLAHIDALVIGGSQIRDRLLIPELENPNEDEPARVTTAALALIAADGYELLQPALSHPQSFVRGAAVRAAALARRPEIDRWASSRLAMSTSAHERTGLLDLHASCGLEPPRALVASLHGDDPALLAAAARAARWADARTHVAAVERLLDHEDPAVREAALVTALCFGSSRAWMACREWAVEDPGPSPMAMALCAALGGPAEHTRLTRRLSDETTCDAVLLALAFSGNASLVPLLIDYLRGTNVVRAKLAAQAISTITGLDLNDDRFAAPASSAGQTTRDASGASDAEEMEARAALPPLEDDDLAAHLVPLPEDALPTPNADAIEEFWTEHAADFAPNRRYLAGEAFGSGTLTSQLERAPMRRRHVLALSLCIRTCATTWIDTRGWSADQQSRLAAIRARGARTALRSIGGW